MAYGGHHPFPALFHAPIILLLLSLLLLPPAAVGQVYLLQPGQEIFGTIQEHITKDDSETLVDLALQYDLGYNEITAANPDLDPWYPGKDKQVRIPTTWILPLIDDGLDDEQNQYFVVQTGSFITREHAMQQYAMVAAKMAKAGSHQLRIEKIGLYFGVRLGRFRDRDAAERLLAEIRAGFPEARLLTVYFKPERIVHPETLEETRQVQRPRTRPCIVVNLAEYRLYRIEQPPSGIQGLSVRTFPIGIGREGFATTPGKYRVADKLRKPPWIIPPSALADYPEYKGIIPPGPDNPLGDYALRLSRSDYLIHGTHKPLGVGRRVSRGCMRMYPNDIEQLFKASGVGDEVIITYQPVKIGVSGTTIYVEAHEDYLAAGNLQQQAVALLRRLGLLEKINMQALFRLINDAQGYPLPLPELAGGSS